MVLDRVGTRRCGRMVGCVQMQNRFIQWLRAHLNDPFFLDHKQMLMCLVCSAWVPNWKNGLRMRQTIDLSLRTYQSQEDMTEIKTATYLDP